MVFSFLLSLYWRLEVRMNALRRSLTSSHALAMSIDDF